MINTIPNMGVIASIKVTEYSVQVLVDGPFIYWKLDEASGIANGATSVVDSSGNSRTGTYVSGGLASVSASGAKANPNTKTSFDFSVASSRVIRSNPHSGAAIAASYLECFFKMASTSQPEEFIMGMTQNSSPAYSGASIGIKGQSLVIRQIGSSALNAQSFIGPRVLDTNWHHVFVEMRTGVADSYGNASMICKTYLDGYLVNDITINTSVATISTGPDFNVGGTPYTHPFAVKFTGLIDEAACYTSPVSEARIAAHIGSSPIPSLRNFLRSSDDMLTTFWNVILGFNRALSAEPSPIGGTSSVIDMTVSSAGSSAKYFAQSNFPLRSGVPIVLSYYCKVIPTASPVDYFCIGFSDGISYTAFSVFNISTGAFVAHYNVGGGTTNTNPVITSLGSGWYRVSASHTPGVTSWRGNIQAFPCGNSSNPGTYAADIGDGAYVTSPALHYGTTPDTYIGTPAS